MGAHVPASGGEAPLGSAGVRQFLGYSVTIQLYDQKSILWWAGKELDKSKKISEYAGKNEKTKIIVKAQKAGGEQPLREPPVDPKTYEQMVKYYYKKVDETK